MPGAVTHLKIAYIYNKEKGNCFDSKLYLGAICPDCVNVDGNAPKERRWPAHLRHSDLKQWLAVATLYYNVNKGKYSESLLRGYILHILTDIAWDMYFNPPLYRFLSEAGVPESELKQERWNELFGYEQEEAEKAWFKNDVALQLKSAEVEQIGCLDINEMSRWRETVVKVEFRSGKPPKYIDEGVIEQLFQSVLQFSDEIFD